METAIFPRLKEFADTHGLYLDHKGKRACRSGVRCTWMDNNGNKHDLDYVLERGGSSSALGAPVAFIEIAWRRYTKHSRNKAQEIQGAIEPLAETYCRSLPFKGAVLAGEFTEGALRQLRSLGFGIVYFPYNAVVEAFGKVGIDASTDESTPDYVVLNKIEQWDRLSPRRKKLVVKALVENNDTEITEFLAALTETVCRRIVEIVILPLHGQELLATSIGEAMAFLKTYNEAVAQVRFERYEIRLRFRNGNEITGRFNDRPSAIEFLEAYEN
ncbi:MAG: DNA methylase [Dehalococcoidia bacterium]|nr:DNA methylase [Dehalococcoidia bacterium]